MPPCAPSPLFLAPAALPTPRRQLSHPLRRGHLPLPIPAPSRRRRATLSATPFDGGSATASATNTAAVTPTRDTPTSTSTSSTNERPTAPVALYDVAVVGAGPAGLSLSAALCRRRVSVCCVDGAIDAPWPNHYGVWRDEFSPLGLDDCSTTIYPTTAVYAGPDKTVLDRPYLRVDRVKLKERLVQRCVDGAVRLCKGMVTNVEHVSPEVSQVVFGPANRGGRREEGEGGGGWYEIVEEEIVVRARLVVDCTGHALRFTSGEQVEHFRAPWEQAAYGIEAEVEWHPYQVDQMLLMDFRDEHMRGVEEMERMSEERPTFLYVFPTSEHRAFFEETSVIAPTAVPFEELKERLYRRLAHDGVKVTRVIEEELSLIPMGGSLPSRAQRVVGFGGAAGLVHPATGYMVARTVGMADIVAGTIANGLQREGEEWSALGVSEEVWDMTWSKELQRQRDFLGFGAELLGMLSMDESRRFFKAFFALPEELWSKFLGFGLQGPAERVYFALYFFVIASWPIRIGLLKGIVEIGRWRLIRSVLPVWMSAWDES